MRFVLLHHEVPSEVARPSHWDLMFECGGVLKTWELASFPSGESVVLARRLPDHRLAYLEYEGDVSNNRGRVRQVDSGKYRLLSGTKFSVLDNVDRDLAATPIAIEVELSGSVLLGPYQLSQVDETDWRFVPNK